MATMTSRERWLAVLNREKPDRVPMDYWGTPEVTQNLLDYLGLTTEDEMFTALNIDHPVDVEAAYIGPPLAENSDIFGCRYRSIDYGKGTYDECIHHPLAQYDSIAEIEANHTWPSPDWYDYSVIPDQIAAHDDRPIQLQMAGVYTLYTFMRGMEQAFMDFAQNQDLVRYCLDRLYDFHHEKARRSLEQAPGQIDIGYVANDMGTQSNLLFSPDTVRKLFIPGIRHMATLAHDSGLVVFFHSDGAIRKAIPDLIEAGIDILNPLQWRCKGMDRAELKAAFGDRVILHGGVDNQHTLAFGSLDEVRAEVRYNLEVLGAGGGYILAPCHNLQAVNPPQNIVAMYETGYEYGRSS